MNSPAASAPGSALKPRPVPENQVLSDADQNRMRHAYQIIADMVSSSRTDEKKSLIIWETTRFAVNVADHLGLPLPIADSATPATPAARSANATFSATEPGARTNRFIQADDGMDEETIQGLRDLGIRPPANRPEPILTRSRAVTPLVSITFGPYLDTSVDMLVTQRDAFVQELLLAEVAVTRNLTQETQTFTEDEAHRIANQIFSDLVGLSAVKHVDALIMEYKAVNAAGLDSSAGFNAERMSRDPNIPHSLRDFLHTFAVHQQIQSKSTKPKLTSLRETVVDVQLFRRIAKLNNPVSSQERRALTDYFQSAGYLPRGRGQRLKTGVKNFFQQALGLDDAALTWVTDAIVPVATMANIFGNGVLVFLNREHIRQIRVFGNQKMTFAFKLLDRHCPWVADLADMADQHILSPILAGESLANLHFNTAPTLPWANRFEEVNEDEIMG